MQIVDAADWQRPEDLDNPQITGTVTQMLAEIRARGDEAISEYSRNIDGFEPQIIELQAFEAYDLDKATKNHLKIAASRIERFARLQMSMYSDVEASDQYGQFGQHVQPIESMAAYIPGGRFPLVSTALMGLIPARVAGCTSRVALSPSKHTAVLAAASLAGATRFLQLGGAQAIAAAALGSTWMKASQVVVGPGNAYVNEAKAQLQRSVKIDSLAGPSEILMLCDDSANPHWMALDVLAQAEHDPMALSVLASNSDQLLTRIEAEIVTITAQYPKKDTGNIQLVRCRDGAEMVWLANKMAAEHLAVVCRPGTLKNEDLNNYGSLFLGPFSAVALGDYCTGPNHTLPTLGHARHKGGLSVGDFLKIVTWQQVGADNYNGLAQTAICIAEIEELSFHQISLEARLTP